jgi:hypothetical protein
MRSAVDGIDGIGEGINGLRKESVCPKLDPIPLFPFRQKLKDEFSRYD